MEAGKLVGNIGYVILVRQLQDLFVEVNSITQKEGLRN